MGTQDEDIFWRILFAVVGLAIAGISISLLAYMFSKTVIFQDKNTLSVKKQYLGGFIQFVKSYSKQEYSRFELTGSYDLAIIKEERNEKIVLLKQQAEKGYSYQPASVEFLTHELNIFWES